MQKYRLLIDYIYYYFRHQILGYRCFEVTFVIYYKCFISLHLYSLWFRIHIYKSKHPVDGDFIPRWCISKDRSDFYY